MNLSKASRIAVWIICVLCIPAFFINLGYIPFIEDEATRAIVAYEMLQSGNFIVPTINGDPYYYKPPLYNWVIALSYSVFGEVSEFTTRVPTVLLLFGFTYHIYLIVKRQTDHQTYATAVALTFLTCGRILFYDSFLGLIDIGFSWVAFVLLVKFYQVKDNPSQLLSIYLLAAVAYLLKGFPAFVFLACGMAAYIIYFREIKSLLTKWHLGGILILTALLGSYYMAYLQFQNPTEVLSPLLHQSTMRTFLYNDIISVIKHLVMFPLENVYHFLPWSLLTLAGITWLNKDRKEYNRFSDFMGILFLTNIPVYWVSPGTYPRYLIMLIPLYFGYFLAYYFTYKFSVATKSISILLIVLMVIAGLLGLVVAWTPLGDNPLLIGLGIAHFVIVVLLLFAIKRRLIPIWIAMVIILLIMRIFFDFGILTTKNISNGAAKARVETRRIANTYSPLHIYKEGRLDKASSYYLATAKKSPLDRKEELEPNKYYILDTFELDFPLVPHQRIDSFDIVEFRRTVYVIKAE